MVATTRTTEPKFLAVYLNDHLGGSYAGVELARRLTRAHRDQLAGEVLRRLASEITEDRDTLRGIMATLGVRPRRYKAWFAWIGEKVSRLKPNGNLLRRSPLSSLIELEAMRLGVEGKLAGWRVLRLVAEHDSRLDALQFDELQRRARNQADTLEELRMQAAGNLFGPTR